MRQIDVDDCLRLGADHKQVKPVDWAGYQTLIVFLRQFWDETTKTVADDVATLS